VRRLASTGVGVFQVEVASISLAGTGRGMNTDVPNQMRTITDPSPETLC